MHSQKTKKHISKILLFFVLFSFMASAIILPFEAKTAYASTNLPNPVENIDCGVGIISGSLGGCAALAGYYMFYLPANSMLLISGSIFDGFLSFSLSNTSINEPFVMDTWKTVRDIANLSFIFVLLYIAISTIFGLGNYKKLLTNLIIIALIINFSAFFTKVVIDASNVIAVQFYNAITVNTPPGKDTTGLSVPEKRISQIFLSGFDPQRLMSSASVQKWKAGGGGASTLFFVFLAAGVVELVASFVLFMAGFLMLGRMVAFWFLIMASPIAFVAMIIPGARGLFLKWSSSLINQALVAPVFLFFMYVIAQIVQSNFLKSVFQNSGNSAYDVITNIVLVFSTLLITLLMALDVTKKLSGSAGAMATKYAGGNATLNKLRAGRKLAGRGVGHLKNRTMYNASESKRLRSFGRKHPGIGMMIDSTLDKAGAGKYNKYLSGQEKRKASYGAKLAGASSNEKLTRIKYEEKLKEKLKNGKIDKDEYDAKIDSIEKANERVGRMRKEQYATSLENPPVINVKFGKIPIGKFVQKITGEELVNRQAAIKVRKGDKGKGTKLEQIEELVKKVAAEEKKVGDKTKSSAPSEDKSK